MAVDEARLAERAQDREASGAMWIQRSRGRVRAEPAVWDVVVAGVSVQDVAVRIADDRVGARVGRSLINMARSPWHS